MHFLVLSFDWPEIAFCGSHWIQPSAFRLELRANYLALLHDLSRQQPQTTRMTITFASSVAQMSPKGRGASSSCRVPKNIFAKNTVLYNTVIDSIHVCFYLFLVRSHAISGLGIITNFHPRHRYP